MGAAWEGIWHHQQAWMDMRLLQASLAQSRAYNSAARTQLKRIKNETVLALWEADKGLYTSLGRALAALSA